MPARADTPAPDLGPLRARNGLLLGATWAEMFFTDRIQSLRGSTLRLWLVLAFLADETGLSCTQAEAGAHLRMASSPLLKARDELERRGLLRVLRKGERNHARFRLLCPKGGGP